MVPKPVSVCPALQVCTPPYFLKGTSSFQVWLNMKLGFYHFDLYLDDGITAVESQLEA